ncbi:MAG: hypothetical protein ACRCZF_01760, partial [Gemmataceae bacterium]
VARASIATESLARFDRLGPELDKLRAAKLPAPSIGEIERQRLKLLADAEQAQAGIAQLNIDLKARLNLPGHSSEKLWPRGDFAVHPVMIDSEVAVTTALSERGDLRALRTLHQGLTAENLPSIREVVQSMFASALGALPPMAQRFITRRIPNDALIPPEEVESFRQQLHELVVDRERLVAAETRAAVVAVQSAARKVAIARAKVESITQQQGELSRSGGKPAELIPLELEAFRIQSELVQEVMSYHAANAKLRTAQGLWGQQFSGSAAPAAPR